ncbi:MAG: hypothetical protein ACKO68_04450 [Bacteroidota bacterium]
MEDYNDIFLDYIVPVKVNHVFDDADIERLSTASNFSDYLKIKTEIVHPQHHLVFDKGDLTFFGEIYDIHGFL